MLSKKLSLAFSFLLFFSVLAYGQDIALDSEVLNPVVISPDNFKLCVTTLQQALIDAQLWKNSITARTNELDAKQNSIDKKESDLNARQSDLDERESLTVKKENELSEKEKSLIEKESILNERESDSELNKAELKTLRNDLTNALKSSSEAQKKANRLEFRVVVWKGVAITTTATSVFLLIKSAIQ